LLPAEWLASTGTSKMHFDTITLEDRHPKPGNQSAWLGMEQLGKP